MAAAQADPRISGAAVTGSAALGASDRWSDLDLAFAISDPADLHDALREWTSAMYRDHGALHHVDVNFGAAILPRFPPRKHPAGRPGVLSGRGVRRDPIDVPVVVRHLGGSVTHLSGKPRSPNCMGLALRASRPLMHRARKAVAGRIHGQWSARSHSCACLPAPQSSSRPGSRDGSTATRRDSPARSSIGTGA